MSTANSEVQMKPPFAYYGGKQQLAKRILALIPQHIQYTEAFTGGGAIFFAKPPSEVEVLNDTNKELINFYKVVQNEFVYLQREISISLHSRLLHKHARAVYDNPELFTDIKRAWALFILATQSFGAMLDATWGYDVKKNQTPKKCKNKIMAFTEDYPIRLQDVQIECTDALRIIKSRDTPDAFHYVDPPYFNSDCGHYDGYTELDYEQLLITLEKIEGKFLLSSYPSEVLKRFVKKNGWHQIRVEMNLSMSRNGNKKIEVLTANYPIK
jgi:DNA adenine methylase